MPFQINDISLYSVEELSHMLNVTTASIRNYLRHGQLKGQKIMGRWFIADNDVREFFRDLQYTDIILETQAPVSSGNPNDRV